MTKVKWIVLLSLLLLVGHGQVVLGAENSRAVVFVLDNSGSMQTNDPQGLRFVAAARLADQLRSTDKVGLISFTGGAKVQVPLTGLDYNQQREQIAANLQRVGNTSDWTNLKAGLDAAYTELNTLTGDTQGLVVLLSDGEPDPGPQYNREQYLQELWAKVGGLSNKGWPVYTVGLSSKADLPVLQRIAQETGGTAFRAPTANALNGIFQDIMSNFTDAQELGEFVCPLDPLQWGQPNTVEVNSALRQVTFRGFNEGGQEIELQVQDPQGNILTAETKGASVLKGSNYYLITVDKPVPGTWKVKARGNGTGRVKLDGQSRYSIEIMQPFANGTWPLASPLHFVVGLKEEGVPVTDRNLTLILAQQGQEILRFRPGIEEDPTGTWRGDLEQFFKTEGLYNFHLQLKDGQGSILVDKKLALFAKDQPYLEVNPPEKGWLNAPLLLQAKVKYHGANWQKGPMKITVGIAGPGMTREIALQDDGQNGDLVRGDGIYAALFQPMDEGSYRLRFFLQGVGPQGDMDFGSGSYLLAVRAKPVLTIKAAADLAVGQDGVFHLAATSTADDVIQLALQGSLGSYAINKTFSLPPNFQGSLELSLPRAKGGQHLNGQLKATSSGVEVVPAVLPLRLYLRTPWQDLWFSHRLALSLTGAVILLLLLLLGGGSILWAWQRRRWKVQGILVLGYEYKTQRRLIFLNSYDKGCLTLGWGQGVDVALDNTEEVSPEPNGPALRLEVQCAKNLPKFLQGWLTVLGRNRPVLCLSSSLGSGFKLKGKGEKRPATKLKTVLQDGDEIYYHGRRLVFRKYG